MTTSSSFTSTVVPSDSLVVTPIWGFRVICGRSRGCAVAGRIAGRCICAGECTWGAAAVSADLPPAAVGTGVFSETTTRSTLRTYGAAGAGVESDVGIEGRYEAFRV